LHMRNNDSARLLGAAFPAAFDETAETGAEDLAAAGFSAVSLVWQAENRSALAKDAAFMRAAGLTVTSVHGPLVPMPGIRNGVDSLWEAGDAGDEFADYIMDCIEDAAAARIPLVVQHLTYTVSTPGPNETGLSRIRRIGEHARALGVRSAVENMEMPPHVTSALDTLDPDVFGLCWDCGHNFAYTPGFDPLARYKGRVLTVHLHDNDGKSTVGAPHTRDDTHFLPFDGKMDWEDAMARLADALYDGPIMLEVKRGRAPCRNIPEYREMGQRKFFAEAYKRAVRLAEMFEKAKRAKGE